MKRLALQVEHRVKNRIVGVHTLNEKSNTCTIGSARTAKIRVLGEDVAGLHAAFDLAGEEWTICDLGSQSGTWVNKKAVVSYPIKEATVIHIGAHQLKVTPYEFEADMFNKSSREGKGKYTFHQVVVTKSGLVMETLLLPKADSYSCKLTGAGTLPAPKDFAWTETTHGEWTVKQRLTKTDTVPDATLKEAFLEDFKRPAPLAAAILIFLMMATLSILAPNSPDDELKTLTPQMQNQYTRMIFDSKKVKEAKATAEKMRQSMKGQSRTGVAKTTPGGDAGAKVAGGSAAKPGAKVVMNLKNAGLGALIGKVAMRAGKNAQLVQAAGVNADGKASGRALALGGGSSLDKLGGGGGGHGNETAKVGGLGTAGKGGGSSGYKGSGALSLGNTGSAEVGVLDEETEVDGGLDKELIARYIKSQLGQIRYCYERQLSANPDLYGKIMVKFTIGSAGSVTAQAIGNTSLNNAMVEGCILRRIAGWQFPTPKGGTKVLVTYPFLFKSNK
jgi:pSer/pThr/pTyr-binding forkhead associated (FHA) protein